VVNTAWRSNERGRGGVTEVKLKYPVESSHVHLQYTEYGDGSVYNNNKKLSLCSLMNWML
jgi:hypothetical protein